MVSAAVEIGDAFAQTVNADVQFRSCWPAWPALNTLHFFIELSQQATREQNIRHLTSRLAGAVCLCSYTVGGRLLGQVLGHIL